MLSNLRTTGASSLSNGNAGQVFFFKRVEASITPFNMNNGEMNVTGWRGRINRVKIIKNKIV